MRDNDTKSTPVLRLLACELLLLVGLVATSCDSGTKREDDESRAKQAHPVSADLTVLRMREALRLALIEHKGKSIAADSADAQIRELQKRTQEKLAAGTIPVAEIEKLAWAFVDKARRAHDDGYYRLARACGEGLSSDATARAAGLLILGHAAQSMHEFVKAEAIARELTTLRGNPFDWGLLGDILVDRGALIEASEAYQRMVDAKPCLQSYVRAGHIRMLAGDLDGAVQLTEHAVRSGSRRAPEPLAWAYTRLSRLHMLRGEEAEALQAAACALEVLPTSAAALLLRASVEAARGQKQAALADYRNAARLAPLPEYQWALADALRDSGQEAEAATVERELEESGARNDPRTFAFYLLTRSKRLEEVSELLTKELEQRRDANTLDALAFLQFRQGKNNEAQKTILGALATRTCEPRVLLHAALITKAIATAPQDIEHAMQRARRMAHGLLPSERKLLQESFPD